MSSRHILISEALFQRLTYEEPPPEEVIMDDKYYMKKLAEMEMQHSQRLGLTEDVFWSTITRVEQLVGMNKPQPCAGIKTDFLTCLNDSNYKGLQCTQLFQRFTECLNSATTETFQDLRKPELPLQ